MAGGRLRDGRDALDIVDGRSGVNWGCDGGDVERRLTAFQLLGAGSVRMPECASGPLCAEGRWQKEGPIASWLFQERGQRDSGSKGSILQPLRGEQLRQSER